MLTQERLKELLHYDPDTGLFTWIKSTNTSIKINSVAGGKTSRGYIQIRADKKLYLAHRLAWLYFYGNFPESFLDHVNEKPSDNRISNLRLATHQENGHNKSTPHKNNTSGFLGVTWQKLNKKWLAQIRLNGKRKHLGLFNTPESAHKAYLEAKRELHPFWREK
mgnify:CR=1 FL=1|jgi:hypothetical protein